MRKLGMGLAAAVLAVSTVFGGTALKNVSQVKAADTDYTYVYAGLSWEEYWNAEGVPRKMQSILEKLSKI